jgi:superfamily II DNA or RNA helicase
MNLRPYQQKMVDDIRLQYQMGKRSVLGVLSTGGGKTCIFSYIAQSAAKKGNRACILVHRAELLDQASRSLQRMGVTHGRIAAGRSMDLSHAVQVASVQTLARRLHKLPRDFFQLLVVDEAHHSNAGTWAAVISHFSAAKLLGVTATPIRGDGRGLGEWYEAMVEGPSAKWLTDNGFLAAARVLAPPGFDAAGLRKRMGDFDQRDAEQRVATIMGDCCSHYRKHLSGRTAIAFCCSVAHAEAVAALFTSHGIAASSIDGSMTGEQRRDLLQALETGRLKVLTSCALIGEGVDVPSVGGCILLRPTQSVSLHLQMIGRCLRPAPGKPAAVVLDHVGNTLRLGHHLEEREWSLDGIKKRDRDKAPSVKVCPQCFAAMASQVRQCIECGHQFAPEVRELQQVEGELVEVFNNGLHIGAKVNIWYGDNWTRSNNDVGNWIVLGISPEGIVTVGLKKGADWPGNDEFVSYQNLPASKVRLRGKKQEQGSAQSLDDLRQLAQRRGYRRGWAERVYQARLIKRHEL